MDNNKPYKIFGQHDENTITQFINMLGHPSAVAGALMADGHAGYDMPIGGVIAYRDAVSVSGVGFDIGCGNLAVKTDLLIERFNVEQLNEIADEINNTISFGVGRSNKDNSVVLENEPFFHRNEWEIIPGEFRTSVRERSKSQLGTVGSGNHYVDVFSDTHGFLWVGVHFGSRGFGHWVASSFLSLAAGANWGDRVKEGGNSVLDMKTDLGKDYYALMDLAGCYAHIGRKWVANKVVQILGGKPIRTVSNHHNFAWLEQHEPFGHVYVVRKGATPAYPHQISFVGGSMGDISVILSGSDRNGTTSSDEFGTLFSTVHGAGRVMSRNVARGKLNRKTGEIISVGKISKDDMNAWINDIGVILRGGDLDEAPQAYRRLPDVLKFHFESVKLNEILKPIIVVMAGRTEFDPYKD